MSQRSDSDHPGFPASNHSENSDSRVECYNETDLDLPVDLDTLTGLIDLLEEHENAHFSFVEVVFVDEAGIVEINKKHLDRDYITDIISFRYDDDRSHGQVEGTLFCCAPRITEQSGEFNETAEREFRRIIIHGLLHLLDYQDAEDKDKQRMRELEDRYLSLSE